MDPMQKLKNVLKRYGQDPMKPRPDKILRTIDAILEDDDGTIDRRQPPLELIVYAINSILYPSYLPELLPDLVQLITMVEFYRLQFTEKASVLITANEILIMQQDSQLSPLTEVQYKYCQHIVKEETRSFLREMFLENISTCCMQDLKRLWLENSNTEFWLRWNEYFSIFQNTGNTSHSFHHKLKPNEIIKLQQEASLLAQFMEDTVRTAAEQADDGQSIQDVFELESFRQQFLTNALPPELIESLKYHLDFVLDVVNEINQIEDSEATKETN